MKTGNVPDSQKIFGFIPLRGGSKSIPGKNIRLIAGRPLAYWAIDASVNCSLIDHTFIATDCERIKQVVEAYGSNKITVIGRSVSTATDEASTESVMLEFAGRNSFSKMVLLQATSPLINAADVTNGLTRLQQTGADSLVSVVYQGRFRWCLDKESTASPQNYNPLARPRRQDFMGDYIENGAFYVSNRKKLLETGSRLHGKIIAYPMSPETYFEVDEPHDWLLIESLLRQRKRISDAMQRPKIKLFLTDVDGVLTDAGMYYTEHGDEIKKFNTKDGLGLRLLQEAGVKVGIITAENTLMVERRAGKLGVDILEQNCKNKEKAVELIIKDLGIPWEQVAYIGDDLNDINVMQRVGWSACPLDARNEVKATSTTQIQVRGGDGAVREFAELVIASIKAQEAIATEE